MKDLSKIIKDFEKLPYKGYVHNRPKHEPTDSYFYLSSQLDKCMMRADAFNFHVEPVRTKITGTQQIPSSQIFDSDNRESKEILAHENLLQVFCTNESESEIVISDGRSTDESE